MVEVAAVGIERLVLVSTDKAVYATNVMGQSKAVCGWIIESFASHRRASRRVFVAVRFGNVLGSRGSVVPFFRSRSNAAARHGHRPGDDAFLHDDPRGSCPGAPGRGRWAARGAFALDMGEPVKILDLARQMIHLSGKDESQVPIVFTGARAGEKVHEVLWNEGEAVGPTSHPKIMRAARPQIDPAWLEESLAVLERLVEEGDTLGVVAKLRTMVAEPARTGREAVLEDTLH